MRLKTRQGVDRLKTPVHESVLYRWIGEEEAQIVAAVEPRTEQSGSGGVRAEDIPVPIDGIGGALLVSMDGILNKSVVVVLRWAGRHVGQPREVHEVPMLDAIELQDVRNGFENFTRDVLRSSLFDPLVPGRSDAGQQCDLFAA